jgi:PAS domain S-box-containing protein
MTRITSPRARLVAFVLLVGLLEAAVTVPAAVWPDVYPPAAAAGLAVVVAIAAVGLLAGRFRRRTLEHGAVAAELDAVLTAASDAIVEVDLNGVIIGWSAGAEALYGFNAEEAAGRPLSSLWIAEPEDPAVQDVLEAIQRGEPVRDRAAVHRSKDETELSVSLTTAPLFGEAGEVAGAILAITDVSDRLRAWARVGELDAKQRALMQGLPVVPYFRAVGDRAALIDIGPGVQDLLGYSTEELLAHPDLFSRLLHPDDREQVIGETAAARSRGEPFRSEYRMLLRGGGVVWVRDEAFTVRDAQGEPLFVQGHLTDVGERRRAAEQRERLLTAERAATAESLSRQRKLDFLARAAAVLASSPEFETTIRRVAELAVRDIADWCIVDLIEEDGSPTRLAVARGEPAPPPPEPASDPEPDVLQVIRSGRAQLTASRIRVPLLTRGRAIGALTLITTAPGRAYGADDLALVQNLAEAAALAVENGRLQREVEERADAARVLAYVGDGVMLVDRGGVIRLWNPAAEAITGFAAASLLNHAAGDAIPGWHAVVERTPVVDSPEPVHAETLPFETARGERWISISGVEFFDGTVYAFRDVTDDHRLHELKADFVATASHELRTPLAAVYGAAQTLRRHDFALDEAGRERFVSLIVDESDRLGRIVNEILLASQLDADRVDLTSEPFDARDLLERVAESIRTHAPPGIAIEIVAPDSMPLIAADRDRVRQVLVNLVENAIKYSPDGGVVEVGVETGDGQVRFHVRDEGIGIPDDEQARIFEKFYRLDPAMTRGVGGTGLGLYICNELVDRMGGRIWVQSTSGGGSTFFFELPATEPSSARVVAPETATTSISPQ